MERHVHALRSAGQTCGHAPPEDDPFLNHTVYEHGYVLQARTGGRSFNSP
jgi:hypothetical protein